ncbi:flagellar basal-body rod protein FlgG [Desulfofalx alkaliphila]|uniref:flagellar basal-body rod protein FlgG n=1 Tax=Desulfofalx alkaliphila TaxID=105483 RepID=UPI0004E26C96|nr:flagellar basal-body rod protein FlgG [Desulfofalx alkaliphila]
MLKTIQSARSGLYAQQLQMDALGNNIANINTTGYKKEKVEFAELVRQRLGHRGTPVLADTEKVPEVGGGVRPTQVAKVFSQGELQPTGRPLDLAISGDGFFRLVKDGETLYTRAGQFSLTADGRIINPAGYQLPQLTVPQGTQEINIGDDGSVTATDEEGKTTSLGTITLYRFENTGGLIPRGENMYQAGEAAGAIYNDNTGEIKQGYLERSNVDIVEEMVKMIEAQRAYSLNSRSIRTADEMWGIANNIRK